MAESKEPKAVQEFSEESCGNGVQFDFELLDLQWIQTQEKPTYHGWPTVANVGEDKLVIVCSGDREAHVDPFGKVLMYESCDKGASWSVPRILADGPLDDRDAGITVTSKGTWLVNYFTSIYFACYKPMEPTRPHWKEKEDKITISLLKEEHGFFMLRSTDQGKTWSPKYRIGVNNVHGAIVLNDGSLFYCGRGYFPGCLATATHGNDIVSMRSTDDGVTWEEISHYYGEIDGYRLGAWHEMHSVQADDGTIITQIRCHNNAPPRTLQMESKDGGNTWENLHEVCGGFPSHLLKLSDGRLLMSYGYRKENYGNRCRVSTDNGKSWSEPIILSGNAPSHDLGYPSTAELSDGTLVTVWYEYKPDVNVALLRCARWKLK
jgi:Neuraminidase (sialidase)